MKENNFDVSVVIITHNQVAYLNRAIDSVLNQNFDKTYEIIVISDANDENKTEEILKSYKDKYDNFNYYNVENHSAFFSRNDGILKAKGKYICFLDGDDFYHENFLKVMFKNITKYNADIVCCSSYRYKNNKKISYPLRKKCVLNKYNAIKKLFFDAYIRSFMTIKMYRKDLLLNIVNNFQFKKKFNFVYEDSLTNFLAFKNSNIVINIPDLLYFYNKDNVSSLTRAISCYQDNINVSAFIMNNIKDSKDEKLLKIFTRSYFRKKLLLAFDLSKLNKIKNPNNKKIKKTAYKELKEIYKKHLIRKDASYNDFLNNLIYKD